MYAHWSTHSRAHLLADVYVLTKDQLDTAGIIILHQQWTFLVMSSLMGTVSAVCPLTLPHAAMPRICTELHCDSQSV